MKDKKVIIAIAVFVVAAAVAAVGIHNAKKTNEGNKPKAIESSVQEEKKTDGTQTENKEDSTANEKETQKDAQKSEEETKTPVFMYFVSEKDSDYDAALKVFEELKKEYSGKIEFDLKNVTKDPKLLENFSLVDGNTPALIMDGKEGIVGFEFKTTDKEVLKAEIEKALK